MNDKDSYMKVWKLCTNDYYSFYDAGNTIYMRREKMKTLVKKMTASDYK